MRVLHVTEAAVGGVATYLNELLPLQRKLYGHQAIGLCVAAQESGNLPEASASAAAMYGYSRTGRDPASLWRLYGRLWQARQAFKPDLIHAHSSIAGALVRVQPQAVPCVYSPHGWAFEMEAPVWVQRAYAVLERRLAGRAARIINVSEYERDLGIATGLPASRQSVVRSGIAAGRRHQRRGERRPGPWRLLFVGRFDRQKGLDWLLELFAQLPQQQFELSIVGGAVRGQPLELPQQSNIQLRGWLQGEALDAAYDAADVLIVPSRWETFGLVAVEAMRRGTPLLVSRRGGLPEVLGPEDGCGRSFRLEEPASLRSLLMALDAEQLQRWQQAASQRFLQYFSSEQMTAAMDEIYRQVVALPAGPYYEEQA